MNKLKAIIEKKLKEMSTTGGGAGAASFTPGTGAQYVSPFAFNPNKKAEGAAKNYYYKLGFKPVPKKIKGSGLETKQLFEEQTPEEFQKERIEAFESIRNKLNDIYKLIDSAQDYTVDFYKTKPASYEVAKPTDLILDYLKDIESLLR